MRFNKIAIIGVGLIGGSIGLALRKKKLAGQITGVCRHQASLVRAKKIGAINSGTLDLKEAVINADLVILAMPVKQIIKTAKMIKPFLSKGCVVTDVGSTKEMIVKQLDKTFSQQAYFVGSHPMAGSEKKGASFARVDLFSNSLCFITRTKNTNRGALNKIDAFWKSLGCRVKTLSPGKHDQIVALISHLPHLAAAQLVQVARGNLKFAATGFTDTTRIAASDAEIWTDIFLSNKKAVIAAIDQYIKQLKKVRNLIARNKESELNREFKKIKLLRDGLRK